MGSRPRPPPTPDSRPGDRARFREETSTGHRPRDPAHAAPIWRVHYIFLKPTGGPSPTGPQPHRVAQIHIGNPKSDGFASGPRHNAHGPHERTCRPPRTEIRGTVPRSDRPTQAAHTTAAINPSRMTHRRTQQRWPPHAFWGRVAFGDRTIPRAFCVFHTARSAPRTRRVTRHAVVDDSGTTRPAHSTVGRGRPVGSVVKSVAVFPTRFDRVIEAQCSERMYRYIL